VATSPNVDNMARIADALEAIAAVQTHNLWDEHLETPTKGKNEKMFEQFVKTHPCPGCSKK
jgi:hypothetical protein